MLSPVLFYSGFLFALGMHRSNSAPVPVPEPALGPLAIAGIGTGTFLAGSAIGAGVGILGTKAHYEHKELERKADQADDADDDKDHHQESGGGSGMYKPEMSHTPAPPNYSGGHGW